MKKLILFSAFLGVLGVVANTAHANCYCPQGALSGGLCYIPQGQSQTMRPIGYAICQGGARKQSDYQYNPKIHYQEDCQPTQDGGQACSLYANDRLNFTDFTDKNGKMIFRRYYYEDHRKIVKQESAYNGKNNRHGKTVIYYDNGQPKYVLNYVNNKAQGEERQYYENGKLKGIIYYDKGQFHGQFSYFDENEQLIRTETFDKDNKTHSQEYLNGQKHGQELFYKTNKKGKTKVTKKVLWQHGVPKS